MLIYFAFLDFFLPSAFVAAPAASWLRHTVCQHSPLSRQGCRDDATCASFSLAASASSSALLTGAAPM